MKIEKALQRESFPILPYDLTVNILSRLPIKSLVQLKCVSKSWLNLFTDPYLAKMHFNRSHNRKLVSSCTIAKPSRFSNTPIVVFSLDTDESKLTLHIDSPLPFGTKSIRFFGSCDGLILFSTFPSNTLYLLNPSTRELNKIPSSPFRNRETVSYGFGYDASARDYKIVELSWSSERNKSNVSVYALKINYWRIVHDFPYTIKFRNRGKLFNGALHWLTYDDDNMSKIVAFHLANDKFQDFFLPDYETPPHSIEVVKGCLCIITVTRELWVMKVYGKRESWTKAATLPNEGPLNLSNDDEIQFLTNQWLCAYNIEKNTYSSIQKIPCIRGCQDTFRSHEAEIFYESIVSPHSSHIRQ
ncbi:F-box/kelch-repeat protein At3g23880-like [Cornus florida]|uniref:F-box/kelch-repeat protein At3g23880-like n=1 Tax=Cornus florida TaxID=4283 RepID=UPI0028963CF9|nr:F-box/kelch-repeat protein At3g23880-like [Cornus florida]